MLLSTNWSWLITANVLLFCVLISFVFLIWNFFLFRFASWLPLKCDVLLDISFTFTLEMHWKVGQILFVGKSSSCRKFQFISVWFTWITSGREPKAGAPRIIRYNNGKFVWKSCYFTDPLFLSLLSRPYFFLVLLKFDHAQFAKTRSQCFFSKQRTSPRQLKHFLPVIFQDLTLACQWVD